MKKTKPTNKVLRTLIKLKLIPEETSEDTDPEIIEDYGDTNTLLYTNQIITNNWFDDAKDYPPNSLEGYPWDEPNKRTSEEEFSSTSTNSMLYTHTSHSLPPNTTKGQHHPPTIERTPKVAKVA